MNPIWISKLEAPTHTEGPLAPRTFAIKDNIDLAGLPTTAGCPAFAYQPTASATVVQKLIDAGATPIGKTNLDQFATGLVGTRSPYGSCASVFNENYISGGSSSGSALAVATKQVDFALGTDTAGSGRVPAAFNAIIGLKPTRGVLSTQGVVPACRSLDCVSIFARDIPTVKAVFEAARETYVPSAIPNKFRFGVPPPDQREFFGDTEAQALYETAILQAEALGGQKVEIDFAPFRAAADLLYSGPWVAERLAAIESFIATHADEMDPIVRQIIQGGAKHTAVDAFRAQYRLHDFRFAAAAEWERMDVMLLPTTGTIYTHQQIANDPIQLNTNLGYYTNFVNLMDLAAIAIPAGLRPNGLPFGIQFIGPANTDDALLQLADRFLNNTVRVAVLGAHLTGQPLNWQLTERNARLLRTTRTAPGYRFYALAGSKPAKPGLIRDESFAGPGIEVEVWAMDTEKFGSFVAAIPPPLGIGSATLANGEIVKCFICEPCAIAAATDITHHGGWRNYLASH